MAHNLKAEKVRLVNRSSMNPCNNTCNTATNGIFCSFYMLFKEMHCRIAQFRHPSKIISKGVLWSVLRYGDCFFAIKRKELLYCNLKKG